MTYKQLLEELQELPTDRLNDTVTVFEPYEDEFIAVTSTGIASERTVDVLDAGHFYLVLKA
jgi:hypothetical protein